MMHAIKTISIALLTLLVARLTLHWTLVQQADIGRTAIPMSDLDAFVTKVETKAA